MKKTAGEQIRRARLARGWTLRHLGERLGVAESTVCRWEKGTRRPHDPVRLADLLDISIRVLAERHNQRKVTNK
jgi:transcriptional regulator with XRE-family HTH domain